MWGVDALAMLTPGISPMAFALNNPISLVDPTGLAPTGLFPLAAFADYENERKKAGMVTAEDNGNGKETERNRGRNEIISNSEEPNKTSGSNNAKGSFFSRLKKKVKSWFGTPTITVEDILLMEFIPDEDSPNVVEAQSKNLPPANATAEEYAAWLESNKATGALIYDNPEDFIPNPKSLLKAGIKFGACFFSNILLLSAKKPQLLLGTGKRLLQPLGLGSTGRTIAYNLKEQLAMEEIMSNPAMGRILIQTMKDASGRWNGWSKMSNKTAHGIEIHFNALWDNGAIKAIDDFKFTGGQ